MAENEHGRRLAMVESSLYGDSSKKGALHRILDVENLVTEHIKECRDTRKEFRVWLMGILAAVITAMAVAWLKFG